MARAGELGFAVSRPWGESRSYDFVAGRPGRFVSVQVTSTHPSGGQGGGQGDGVLVFEVEVCQVRGLPGSLATLAGCLGDRRFPELRRAGLRGGIWRGASFERGGADGAGCEILYAFSGAGECDSGQERRRELEQSERKTLRGQYARDPSLRLKSGSVRDEAFKMENLHLWLSGWWREFPPGCSASPSRDGRGDRPHMGCAHLGRFNMGAPNNRAFQQLRRSNNCVPTWCHRGMREFFTPSNLLKGLAKRIWAENINS